MTVTTLLARWSQATASGLMSFEKSESARYRSFRDPVASRAIRTSCSRYSSQTSISSTPSRYQR